MTLGGGRFIRAVVEVDGAQGVEDARHTVELAYGGSEALYKLPEGAEVTGTVELSATTCLPSWSHEFYVEDPQKEGTLVCRLSILRDCTLLAFARDLNGEHYCERINIGNALIDLEKTPQEFMQAIPWVRSLEFHVPTAGPDFRLLSRDYFTTLPSGEIIAFLLSRVVSPVPYCGGSSPCSKAEVLAAKVMLRDKIREAFSGRREDDK